MRRGIAAALAVAALSCGVWAAEYDDFGRGLNAVNRGEPDVAISSFTAALAAGDLPPTYIASAYLGRAKAYLLKRRCNDALADIDVVLEADPSNREAFLERAAVDGCLGKADAAIADMTTAAKLHPTAFADQVLGLFLWSNGHYSRATKAFEDEFQYLRNSSVRGAFALLWYTISAGRVAGGSTTPPNAISDFDCGDWNVIDFSMVSCRSWPGPLVDFYNGKIEKDDVYYRLKEDRFGDPVNDVVKAERTCDADFYVGEWYLIHQHDNRAKTLLLKAASECPPNMDELQTSRTEVKRQSWGKGGHG